MRCVVNIGTEKTGTTSLQRTLEKNAALLSQAGVIYPQVFAGGEHAKLYCYALNDDTFDHRKQRYDITDAAAMQAFRKSFATAFDAALDTPHPEPVALMVTEHLARLQKVPEVERLRDFLTARFERIDIVVYLRRQDRMMRSLYSTTMKNGGTRDHVYPEPEHAAYTVHDYRRLCDLWTSVWGQDRFHIRVFEPDKLIGRDVVADFLATAGLTDRVSDLPLQQVKANESPDQDSLMILRALNQHLTPAARGPLGRYFAEAFPGKGMPVTRAEATAFLDHFQDGNAYVARTYLGQEQLFDLADLDQLPETVETQMPDTDEVIARFAEIWTRQMQQYKKRTRSDAAKRKPRRTS